MGNCQNLFKLLEMLIGIITNPQIQDCLDNLRPDIQAMADSKPIESSTSEDS